jgi:MFS family permease
MSILTPSDEVVHEAAASGAPERKFKVSEHLLLACFWFGTNFIWGAFLGPVLASQMSRLAPENSAAYLGVLYTVGAFPALLVPLIFGPLSDRSNHRWGRRRPFILGGGLLAIMGLLAMIGAYNALSIPLYFSAYLVLQIGANIALAAYSGVIPDLVPVNERGTASGYMALMSQVATLIGALVAGFMVTSRQDSAMFLLIIGVFAVFLALTLYGVKETPQDKRHPKLDYIAYLKSLWIDPRKYPDFAWVWLTRALMMFGFYAIQPFILYFLRDVTKVEKPASTAGIVFGVILIASTLSGFIGGVISDRTGRKPVVVAASMIIAVMSIVLVFCSNLTQALIAGVAFGLGYGAYISVDWALGTDVLPNREDAGKDMAIWHVSMTLPQQVAPLTAGMILSLYRGPSIIEDGKSVATYQHAGYITIFMIAAACFLLGGLLVKKVRGAR